MTTLVTASKYTALNIGSGVRPNTNLTFLWVDSGAWPVDVTADVRRLPFRDEQFGFVHCSHVIEHVPYQDVDSTLRELRRVLGPDGVFYISAPDMDRAKAAGSQEWIQCTRKGGFKKGWEHHWVCTVTKLRRLLIAAGFTPSWASKPPPGFPPNTHGWPVEFESHFLCRRDDYPWPQSFPTGMEIVT